MEKIKYYGLIAAKYKEDKRHPHYIAKVLLITCSENGFLHPVKICTKEQVIGLMGEQQIFTMQWSYQKRNWIKGAAVSSEKRNGELFLRSNPNDIESDNLSQLIDMDYFSK